MAALRLICIFLLSPLVLAATNMHKDGSTTVKCDTMPKSCKDVVQKGPGIYQVAMMDSGMDMLCDTQTERGGWTVIHRRTKGDVNFYRDWEDFKYGFGDYDGDFWWGLEHVYHITSKARYELYVSFDYKHKQYYARYDHFKVLSEKENYKLHVFGYSGNAGNSLGDHNNAAFTTKDRDNDRRPRDNCAQLYKGAWWHVNCHQVHLNGQWGSKEYGVGLNWQQTTSHYDSATNVVMKIRQYYD